MDPMREYAPAAMVVRRVLFIQTATTPVLGADAWVLLRIIEHLDRADHEIHVACRRGPVDEPTPVWSEVTGMEHVHEVECDLGPELSTTAGVDKALAAARTAMAVVSLVRLGMRIRRRGIRVVHAGDRPRDALAAVLLGRLTGAISVVHVHQVYSGWWTRLLRWAVARADVVVPVSEFVATSLVEGGVDAARVRPVLNAIDPDRWTPGVGRRSLRDELGIAVEASVVLTVCRLFPGKGVAELIRAFAGVRDRVPGAQLLVAGDDPVPGGPYLSELRELVTELDLTEQVHLLGRRSDVPHLMAAADVFALPSTAEPFGLVYLEAMAMELPTVALDHGGAAEIIRHGETGLLSPSGDIEGLEDHLVTLLGDPDRRAAMGERGRAAVEASFTLERQAREVAQLYAAVLEPADGEPS
jgi:glycosyltransferase involved in cell wall biosynthesis